MFQKEELSLGCFSSEETTQLVRNETFFNRFSALFNNFLFPFPLGFYICQLPEHRRHPHTDVNDNKIKILLIWPTGDLDLFLEDIFTSSSSISMGQDEDSVFVNSHLSFVSVMEDFKETSESMRLSIASIRPKEWSSLPSQRQNQQQTTTTEPPAAMETTFANLDPVSALTAEKIAILKEDEKEMIIQSNKNTLESLKTKFSQLNCENCLVDFHYFILSKDILDMMGYLLDNELIAFPDTKDANWSRSFSLTNKTVASATTPKNVHLHFMEEGEEQEEGEEVEASTIPMNTDSNETSSIQLENHYFPIKSDFASFQKLFSQSFQMISFQKIIQETLFPLNYCGIDCEMCSTKEGLELTRITIIHPLHGIIIDCLVMRFLFSF
jgi:hypothetical protein